MEDECISTFLLESQVLRRHFSPSSGEGTSGVKFLPNTPLDGEKCLLNTCDSSEKVYMHSSSMQYCYIITTVLSLQSQQVYQPRSKSGQTCGWHPNIWKKFHREWHYTAASGGHFQFRRHSWTNNPTIGLLGVPRNLHEHPKLRMD